VPLPETLRERECSPGSGFRVQSRVQGSGFRVQEKMERKLPVCSFLNPEP
jgi:hypothetical protein